MKKILIILALITLWDSADALELKWSAPTTNADGTALTDLAGYKIYSGPASRDYKDSIDVGNVTSKAMPDIEGTAYYTVTAYDQLGNESGYANEVAVTWKNPPDGSQILLTGQNQSIVCNGCTLIINGQTQ